MTKKIISFNVNGVRAIINKDFSEDMKNINPDILCLQETKGQKEQVLEALSEFSDYHIYTNSAVRKGYSGTAILTKEKPLQVIYGIGEEEHDQEGRVITLAFENFYLTCVYVPNSGAELARLDYRETWDNAFLNFLKNREQEKPVIVCGDLNVAHRDIDLARPKANYNKHAGYTQKEIDGMDALQKNGFIDSFRHFHPDTVKYSWWSYRGGARARNVGWRIDYFLVSPKLIEKVRKSDILNEIMGSDHCPVLLEIDI